MPLCGRGGARATLDRQLKYTAAAVRSGGRMQQLRRRRLALVPS